MPQQHAPARQGDGERPTDAEAARRIEALARNTARRMCFVPRGRVLFDSDDAYAVAFEGGWKAHLCYESGMGCAWRSWVIYGIQRGLLEAFRQFDYGAKRNRAGVVAPEFRSLEAEIRSVRVRDEEIQPVVEDVIADSHDAYAQADTAMECATTLRVLRWLPPRESAVLRGFYLEDVTLAEMARRLRLSESRVHQLRKAGVKRARLMLGGQGV